MNEENGKRPGILKMASAVIRAPFEERIARQEAAEYEQLQYRAASKMLQEVVRRVEPEDDGFLLIGSGSERALDESESGTLLEQATKAAYGNTHAIGYLGSLKRFVIGEGPQITPVLDDDKKKESLDAWWTKFGKVNNWEKLEDEIAVRRWRDGEIFIRKFEQDDEDDGANPKLSTRVQQLLAKHDVELQGPEVLAGMIRIRLIPPNQILDPDGTATHGIVTAEDDVQTVLGYCWSPDGKGIKEIIPAAEVLHDKIRVDADVKRGRSALEPLLKRTKQYEQWLNYRIILILCAVRWCW